MLVSGKRRILATSMLVIMVLMLIAPFSAKDTFGYTEKYGTINGTYVNVRTSAGTAGNTNKLKYNGNYVQLNIGNSVTIIGEDRASDGALWYKVKFNYSGGAELTGFVHSAYVDVQENIYTPDTDFESYLSSQGFPESYKDKLRQLHAKYPKWIFVADKINYDWNEVIKNECLLGRSLVHKSSISSWKSLQEGAYNWETGQWATFDGGAWVAASKEFVSYCMDPRNFLDETYIFQFEMLSYQRAIHQKSNVEGLLTNTFMDNKKVENGKTYAEVFMDAAAVSGVSPYHLASRVIQEVGTNGTTGGVTGYYAPSTGNVYKDLYNFYNIGAYAANGRGAVENGLIFASRTDAATLRPWNTREKAIKGGAIYIGNGYINIGQDTIYYEKFDFMGTLYTHQYMTNVQAPKSEALKMSKAYSQDMKKNTALVFKIPVFKNMPESACPCPNTDGSPNSVLESIKIDGYNLTPTFSMMTLEYDLIVPNDVTSIRVSATALDGKASISGTGNIKLNVGNNAVKINCKAENGDVRTYTINVVRKKAENDNPPKPDSQPETTPPAKPEQPTETKPETTTEAKPDNGQTPNYGTSYKIVNDNCITGINPGTTANTLKSKFTLTNCSIEVYKEDGKTKVTDKVGTGNKVVITDKSGKILKEYSCLIYGDVNGDGILNIVDILSQKRDILEIKKLDGVKRQAADINKDGNINIVDILLIKRDILEIAKIIQ